LEDEGEPWLADWLVALDKCTGRKGAFYSRRILCDGVKILKLVIRDYYKINTCHLNSCLENAITPGIEEVALLLSAKYRAKYKFISPFYLMGVETLFVIFFSLVVPCGHHLDLIA